MAQANSYSQEVHNAAVGLVDEDHSELSRRIAGAFLPPYFQHARAIAEREIIPSMNAGEFTFVVDIPPNFERDVLGGRNPAIQLDVDATVMVQGGLGAGYVEQIIMNEIAGFLSRAVGAEPPPVNLAVRVVFNPNVTTAWFTSVMGIINNVSMLAIILSGAAIVREREHGTMDHLLVMPLTPFEIAMSKVWANGLVITVAVALSLYLIVRGWLHVPIAGSIPLFLVGFVLPFLRLGHRHTFGTIARSMPQLGSAALETCRRLATAMQASPSTHFVGFVSYRGQFTGRAQFLFVAIVGGFSRGRHPAFRPRRDGLAAARRSHREGGLRGPRSKARGAAAAASAVSPRAVALASAKAGRGRSRRCGGDTGDP